MGWRNMQAVVVPKVGAVTQWDTHAGQGTQQQSNTSQLTPARNQCHQPNGSNHVAPTKWK